MDLGVIKLFSILLVLERNTLLVKMSKCIAPLLKVAELKK
jgi:hypothetical protein